MGMYFPGYMTGGMDWMLNLSSTDPTWTLPIVTSASFVVSQDAFVYTTTCVICCVVLYPLHF